MSSERIGLFIATQRGFAVLTELVKAGLNVSHVLILKQKAHELSNYTQKSIDFCKENNISCATSEEVKPGEYEQYLRQARCSVWFVISWRFLISEACFSIPEKGIFVLHDSLLPKYRGFCPTNWVLINQEKEIGATLFYITKDVDAGDIVDQVSFKIDDDENARTLNEKFIELYPKMILKNMDAILNGTNSRTVQDEAQATYGERRTPQDGKIDFTQPTDKIISFIRALTKPFPGAFCHYREKKILIWEAHAKKGENGTPGTIAHITEEAVDVYTSDGIVRITEIGLADNPTKNIKLNEVFTVKEEILQ